MTKKEIVLFVDDEENILNSLKRGLIDEDFDCIFVTSGQKALDVLKKEDICVIVSDMRMPGMDGLTLLKEVRAKYPGVVRIVLSGYAQLQQILATVNQADVFKFITKPWKMEDEFIVVIRQALEYYRLQHEKAEFELTMAKQNLAYQNILKKLDDVLKTSRNNMKIHNDMCRNALENLSGKLEKSNNLDEHIIMLNITTNVIKRVFSAMDEDETEKMVEESATCLRNILNESQWIKKFEVLNNFAVNDRFFLNWELLHNCILVFEQLLCSKPGNYYMKIILAPEGGSKTMKFTISILVSVLQGVNAPQLIKDYGSEKDQIIELLNPLFSSALSMMKGTFQSARVDTNIVAKISIAF